MTTVGARRATALAVLVALVALLVAGGCRGGGGDGQGAEQPPTSEGSPEATSGTGTAPPATSTTAKPPARVIATSEGDIPGLVLELLSLRRTGADIVTLEFAVRNVDANSNVFRRDTFSEPDRGVPDFDTVGGTYLTDEVNKKKYLVQRDTNGTCLCSRSIQLPNERDQRVVYFAKFPAPPDGVRTVTVVVPHFLPVDGVGISE